MHTNKISAFLISDFGGAQSELGAKVKTRDEHGSNDTDATVAKWDVIS